MTVLRYQYPNWPGQFDGTETVTQLGAFDFELQEVLEMLNEEREKVETNPQFHGTATWQIKLEKLLKNIAWLNREAETQSELIVWHHATRDWPIKELENAKKKWESATMRLLFGSASSPSQQSLSEKFGIQLVGEADNDSLYCEPEYFEDSALGDYLSRLVYARRYLEVFCSACECSCQPCHCNVETWRSVGRAGQKLLCSQKHTLHSHPTRMIKEKPIRK